MAIRVILDQINGATATHNLSQGWSITRLATITGLAVTPIAAATANTGATFQRALAELIKVTGDRGLSVSPFTIVDVPTYLEEFIPELLSADVVKIRIIYKGYPLPQWEFDSALAQVESNLDRSGTPIVLEYTYPADYKADPSKAGKAADSQGGLFHRPVPEPTVTCKFIVTANMPQMNFAAGEEQPVLIGGDGTSALNYMSALCSLSGKANNNTWNVPGTQGAWKSDPYCYMITKVHGISTDGGNTFQAEVTLQHKEEGWYTFCTFIDPITGKAPADLVDDTGYKQIEAAKTIYLPTNFPVDVPVAAN